MHEMALCESIVGVLEEQALEQDFSRVRRVCLEVGRLAAVEVEALRFCFEVVARGTLAAGARLEIADVPGAAWCLECERSVAVQQRYDACPRCGGYYLQITGGEELRIKELEVE